MNNSVIEVAQKGLNRAYQQGKLIAKLELYRDCLEFERNNPGKDLFIFMAAECDKEEALYNAVKELNKINP